MSLLKKVSEMAVSHRFYSIAQVCSVPSSQRIVDDSPVKWSIRNIVSSRNIGSMPDEQSFVALNTLRDNPGATQQVRRGCSCKQEAYEIIFHV